MKISLDSAKHIVEDINARLNIVPSKELYHDELRIVLNEVSRPTKRAGDGLTLEKFFAMLPKISLSKKDSGAKRRA